MFLFKIELRGHITIWNDISLNQKANGIQYITMVSNWLVFKVVEVMLPPWDKSNVTLMTQS